MHGVADNRRGDMRSAFLRGMKMFASGLVMAELQRAFESGDPDEVENAIPWEDLPANLEDMADEILTLVRNGARASSKYLPRQVQMNVKFDLLNQRSVDFIRQYRFDLIKRFQINPAKGCSR